MTFTKKCFCQKTEETFRTDFPNPKVLDLVFCPECADRAGGMTLMLNITGVPGRTGMWGLKFNDVVLKKKDKQYEKDNDDYIVDVFDSQKVVFDFIPQRTARMFYRIVEVKKGEQIAQKSGLSGKAKTEKPTKLPGKTKSGVEEGDYKKEGK